MEKPEIQEMLEGMLSDEQASEVLHRMSVSPERLTEFREHMALREAMAQDARGEGLTEEEDDNLWAAVLGATGGLVTGGAASSAGLWSWVGRAGAFIATGLAGFFIGTAVSNNDAAETTDNEPIAAVEAPAAGTPAAAATDQPSNQNSSSAAADRVDTVYLTEYITRTVPKVVYRDRIVERIVEVPAEQPTLAAIERSTESSVENQVPASSTSDANASQEPSTQNRNGVDFSYLRNDGGEGNPQSNRTDRSGATDHPLVPIEMITPQEVAVSDPEGAIGVTTTASAPERAHEHDRRKDPNAILKDDGSESDAEGRSPSSSEDADLTDAPSLSLMKDGFDIGYAERLGMVTPAPEVQGASDPAFSARSLDLTYRLSEGRVGVGLRFSYGTFSEVSHTSAINFDLGLSDTIYVQSLASSPEAKAQFVVNYRLPLFTERFAIGVEANAGLSSTRLLAGGEVSAIYLINDWLGAQVGAGYGHYWYTTQKERELLIDLHENTGIAAGLPIDLQGSMIEGRYGLFFRF